MPAIEQVHARVRHLRTLTYIEHEPEPKQVWEGIDRGVQFSVVKFAEPPEAAIGDYTGVKLNLRGGLRARRKVVRDFVQALGKPTMEKLTRVLKKPEVVIWDYPKPQ